MAEFSVWHKDWVNALDLAKVRKPARTSPIHTTITRHYVGFPIHLWEELGAPAKVSVFYWNMDLVITKSNELSMVPVRNQALIRFSQSSRFNFLLQSGRFPDVKVCTIQGVQCILTKNTNVVRVDSRYIEHWRALKQRLAP